MTDTPHIYYTISVLPLKHVVIGVLYACMFVCMCLMLFVSFAFTRTDQTFGIFPPENEMQNYRIIFNVSSNQ